MPETGSRPPDWSLTRIQVRWADDEAAILSQHPWQRDNAGWSATVSIPRDLAGDMAFVTATLRITDKTRALPEPLSEWDRAKKLLVSRMRARGWESADGDIDIR